jgi:hypothetical protein
MASMVMVSPTKDPLSQRKRSATNAFPIYTSNDIDLYSTEQQSYDSLMTKTKRHRQQQQYQEHHSRSKNQLVLSSSTLSSSSGSESRRKRVLDDAFPLNHNNGGGGGGGGCKGGGSRQCYPNFEQSKRHLSLRQNHTLSTPVMSSSFNDNTNQRKRGLDTAFPIEPSDHFRTGGIQLLDEGQGFAGFTPMKRHFSHQQQHKLSTPLESASSSSSSSNDTGQRKRGLDTAFPIEPSDHFRTGGIQLLDEGQGFAGFTPVKRTRVQETTFGLLQDKNTTKQQESPDENQPDANTNHKRGRDSMLGDSDDIIMGCTPTLKRGHLSTSNDIELDRPVFSKRYILQIEQHLKYQKEQAERLRHENFVLKQGVRIQDERNKKLLSKIAQLEYANYALCLRNAGQHSNNMMNDNGNGNVGGVH